MKTRECHLSQNQPRTRVTFCSDSLTPHHFIHHGAKNCLLVCCHLLQPSPPLFPSQTRTHTIIPTDVTYIYLKPPLLSKQLIKVAITKYVLSSTVAFLRYTGSMLPYFACIASSTYYRYPLLYTHAHTHLRSSSFQYILNVYIS